MTGAVAGPGWQPVVAGDYVIVGAGVAGPGQRPLVIACKPGRTGQASRRRALIIS